MSLLTMHRRARLRTTVAFQPAAAAKPSALDIAEIRHFPLREPTSKATYSLLRVKSQSGLIGWGECAFDPAADMKTLQSAWVGRPANTYATIAPGTPFAAALDMALLDILGKAANAPIYGVLGGPTRHKVRAYSSGASKEFPIVVIEAPAPEWRNQGQAYQNRITELVKAVPEDHDFVLASNGQLTAGDAASVSKTVEKQFPLWFDEPCAHANVDALRKVSGETVVPLGFGRGITDPTIFQTLLREGLVDVVRPDLAVFGISGARRVAALAEAYYVAVAPRHDGGPVATAAAIQLAASIPNFFIQHVRIPLDEKDRAMRREIVSPAVEASSAGFLTLSKTPGLGITVNEAALEKYHAS
jgi:galactonate dehydratase